ncbi:hypothetical protein G5714_007778 [Onychostoma macrolepis]|uniref:Uncharacterized protein n=1 Tax=Onychostoma macrolepis TaxID=369639 RepID=A0A7J6CTR2_9TELE|nr:hypothetical protein G5714_007778 [Onychostoma macrolepis]
MAMLKRKLKLQHKQQESVPESSKDATPDDLEENVTSLPSCSSQGSDASIFPMKMKIEFLEEKIKWQEKMIGELENERDFLREQVLGKAKGQDVG